MPALAPSPLGTAAVIVSGLQVCFTFAVHSPLFFVQVVSALCLCTADGRHYKHFMLVDTTTGHERLAVVGEDSARQDRRYTYKALEDVGGLCFENGKAVSTLGWGVCWQQIAHRCDATMR